jgi:NAD(P)-dependent dehydrogenase (short-subunit alcohol dehydrogenase family)
MSTTEVSASPRQREPQLTGQTVVLLGGSAGIGLETARLARAEGADVVLVGRDRERLKRAAREVEAKSAAAFDATDPEALRETLPIGRVVGPEDVAALAIHLMTNTALTGATYDVDGGQQLVS